MKFNVVIGNPPYNRGMDLDFVNRGFDLCDKYCVMITPAKWQTAAEDYQGCASKTIDYKGFREKLVPHMSKVVFYPDCKDVFNILQADGITYYILDKNKTYAKCEVENRCRFQEYFGNSKEVRSILNRESLLNIGNRIVNYLGRYESFKPSNTDKSKTHRVWVNSQFNPGKIGRSLLWSSENNVLVLGRTAIQNDAPSNTCEILFSSDDLEECKSFVSWLNTKFTRFFILINISKLGSILTDDYFRFVPAPPSGKFDHIYTDEELYKAFNLPQKYIDVIEAVIKER